MTIAVVISQPTERQWATFDYPIKARLHNSH